MGSIEAHASTLSWGDILAICLRKGRPVVRIACVALLRTLIVIAPVVLAFLIARNTRDNSHCDEYVHINAFEYFQTHWQRPPIGSDQVLYSVNGISRVYNGEIVYLIFGKAGALLRHFFPHSDPYYIYRACNISLLGITLVVLVSMRCSWFSPWLLALFVVCIPQVIYTYAYANSDAFGVSASVLLFAHVACILDSPPRQWGIIRIAVLALLILLTLLSKVAFELGIVLPSILLVAYFVKTRTSPRWILLRIVLPLLVVYALASWWNPAISPWHARWQKQMMALREQKAIVGRRPSDPQPTFGGDYPTNFNGHYLAANHGTYSQIFTADHHAWLPYNAESFYGRFAYMLVVLPHWLYFSAASIAIALIILTILLMALNRRRIPWPIWLCLSTAPLLIAGNLFGSLYHSFHYDWQPQGRYLFASLVPLFFLCFGTWSTERKWWRAVRCLAILLLMPLCGYVLLQYVALNPFLR
ncbi:MAG TPA: DUF2142 domain-containing protein [Tepidisphaeraceae bacterium]|jgi:hypothetical protein